MTYEQLAARIVEWAAAQPHIRAVIVAGSRARGGAPADHPADAWSDLDLIVFTSEAATYSASAAWLEDIAEPWLAVPNTTGRGDPEWLVLFANGLKVDFVLSPAAPHAGKTATVQELLAACPYRFVLERGVRILYDGNGMQTGERIAVKKGPRPTHPTPEEFRTTVGQMLLDTARTAKMLRRGELWHAGHACGTRLKGHLLTMLEWQARAVRGPACEPWHDGRFLEQWADPGAVAALPELFARYDEGEQWHALFASLELFDRLAAETAEQLGYVYPDPQGPEIVRWIHSLAPRPTGDCWGQAAGHFGLDADP